MIKTPTLQELLEAGVHFGHQVRRGNPRMKEFIFGAREGVHIINLEYSEKLLQEATQFAYDLGKAGKILLFVGTKKQAQSLTQEVAQETGAPYVNFRWVGGTLTNFDEVRKNIRKLLDLKEKQEKGELSRTKREQMLISKALIKFAKEWGGVSKMDKLPDALYIIDCVTERLAVSEAKRMGIPVIGIADSNCNPDLISFPIPGNDDATKSIKIITEAIADAYKAGWKESGREVKDRSRSAGTPQDKEAVNVEESLTVAGDLAEEVAVAEELVEKEEVADSSRAV